MIKSNLFKTIGSLIAVVLALILLYNLSAKIYNAGFKAGESKAKVVDLTDRLALVSKAQQLQQTVNELQSTLNASVTDSKNYKESLDDVQNSYDELLAGIDAGAFRVYVPATCPTSSTDPHRSATTGAARPAARDGGARCELDEKTVRDLAAITRDGDRAIVERNEVIRRYNTARTIQNELNLRQKPKGVLRNEETL